MLTERERRILRCIRICGPLCFGLVPEEKKDTVVSFVRDYRRSEKRENRVQRVWSSIFVGGPVSVR